MNQQTETLPSIEGREFISLADVGDYEEEVIEGYHGERDANAGRGPLPHDIYQMRVCYASRTVPDGSGGNTEIPAGVWEKRLAPSNGSLYYATSIKITSEGNKDGSHDGYERTENLMTLVSKGGTTGVQALLQALGIDTITLNSHQAQIRASSVLAGDGVLLGEEVDWEARLFDKEQPVKDKNGQAVPDGSGGYKKGVEVWRLRGMKNFPKNEDGSYRHEVNLDDGYKLKSGEPLPASLLPARAFNYHRKWVPQSALMKVEKQDGQLAEQMQQSVDNVKSGLSANTTPVVAQRPQTPPQAPQAPQAHQAAAAIGGSPSVAAPRPAYPGPRRSQPPAAPRRVT